MNATTHQARWLSKEHMGRLRKTGNLREALVLDSMKGFIIVEPSGSAIGDGPLLTPLDADFEVRPEWCQGPKKRIAEARKLLQLPDVVR